MRFEATGNHLEAVEGERPTSGSVKWNEAAFAFDAAWEGMERTAVFKTLYGKARAVLLDASNICKVPWEVLSCPSAGLRVSAFGVRPDGTIVTTNYVTVGPVIEGADRNAASGEGATPTVYEQILAQLQATRDHQELTGREAVDQHPIKAVTGLVEALETIPEVMTADELRKILYNGGNENG